MQACMCAVSTWFNEWSNHFLGNVELHPSWLLTGQYLTEDIISHVTHVSSDNNIEGAVASNLFFIMDPVQMQHGLQYTFMTAVYCREAEVE